MDIEDIVQPTEEVTQDCPCCHVPVTMVPYDIGSGPELSCSSCEWCWGANGQPLLEVPVPPGGFAMMFRDCKECGTMVGVRWPDGVAPEHCTEHSPTHTKS